MKKIQILGTGCTRCQQLTRAAQEALAALGLEADVEKVTDWQKILEYGVMATPALAVDGEVKVAGRVPSVEELKELLAGA